MKKINVAILFGGRSVEHEVSLQSARNVVENIDRSKYELTLIGIDHQGQWNLYEEDSYLQSKDDPTKISLGGEKDMINPFALKEMGIDVVFPVLHGMFGEDGTIQGLFKLIDLPFVGADICGSAIGMDKDVMKRLIRDSEIPTLPFVVIRSHERHLCSYQRVCETIKAPFFVKPCHWGSSIGITKVQSEFEFEKAIELAFQYDRKIIIEEAANGREIQCGVLGNAHPIVSLPCEIIPKGDFHSYSSKYLDADGAKFLIPAPLSERELTSVQMTAIRAYQATECEGLARVDMYLRDDGCVFFGEINTIPGLTNNSPFAKMWRTSGLELVEVTDRLIQSSFQRFQEEAKLVCQIVVHEHAWVRT